MVDHGGYLINDELIQAKQQDLRKGMISTWKLIMDVGVMSKKYAPDVQGDVQGDVRSMLSALDAIQFLHN